MKRGSINRQHGDLTSLLCFSSRKENTLNFSTFYWITASAQGVPRSLKYGNILSPRIISVGANRWQPRHQTTSRPRTRNLQRSKSPVPRSIKIREHSFSTDYKYRLEPIDGNPVTKQPPGLVLGISKGANSDDHISTNLASLSVFIVRYCKL
jgi:hypothetical protein